MSDATCPERECEGKSHGWCDVDCDERCPEFDITSFRDLLERSSFGPGYNEEFDVEIRPEDMPGPGAHARLDQWLAEHNKSPKPMKDWLAENGIQFDG
jgi:hypothetical protein